MNLYVLNFQRGFPGISEIPPALPGNL